MSKTFYSDFVNHCLRFYARYPNPIFRCETDKSNWIACKNALNKFSNENKEMLLLIYRDGDTVPDNVYKIATEKEIEQNTIWKLINELEYNVAKSRKLI